MLSFKVNAMIGVQFFGKEDFIRKSTKTTLLTKYIHICISHIQTLYIIHNTK